jgi:nicotinamide riboside kinase
MDEVLASTLRETVVGHLDYVDRLVADGDQRSRLALVDTEITRLTIAWRAVLAEHQPDPDGRCPQCSGWLRRRAHPCPVWTVAHQHLISGRHTPGPGRHSTALLGGT